MIDNVIAPLILLGLVFVGIFIGYHAPHGIEYKQGQIDCINGNIHYELQVQTNKESKWIKINE